MGNDVNLFIDYLLGSISGFLISSPIKYLFTAALLCFVLKFILVLMGRKEV